MAERILPKVAGHGGSIAVSPRESLSSMGVPEIEAKIDIAEQWNRFGAALGDVSSAMYANANREKSELNMHKARTEFNVRRTNIGESKASLQQLVGEQAIGVDGYDFAVDGDITKLSVAQRHRMDLDTQRERGLQNLENDKQKEIFGALYDDYMAGQTNWADSYTSKQFKAVELQQIDTKIKHDLLTIGDVRGDKLKLSERLADIVTDTKAYYRKLGFSQGAINLEVEMNVTEAHRQVIHSILYNDENIDGSRNYLEKNKIFMPDKIYSELKGKIDTEAVGIDANKIADDIIWMRKSGGKEGQRPLTLEEQMQVVRGKKLDPQVDSLVKAQLRQRHADKEKANLKKRKHDVATVQEKMFPLVGTKNGDARVKSTIKLLESPEDRVALTTYWNALVKNHNIAQNKKLKEEEKYRQGKIKETSRLQKIEDKKVTENSYPFLLQAMTDFDEGREQSDIELRHTHNLSPAHLKEFQEYAKEGGVAGQLKTNKVKSAFNLFSGTSAKDAPEQFLRTFDFVKERLDAGKPITDEQINELVTSSLVEGYYAKPTLFRWDQKVSTLEAASTGRLNQLYIPIEDDNEMEQLKADMDAWEPPIPYHSDEDVVAFKNFLIQRSLTPTKKEWKKTSSYSEDFLANR